ncbi:MAG: polyprenyl synthetase family protein [Anaerolineae bacterium]|nr:polyprenyl synthetase family protein [Anaerolineae bacterium]
MDIYQSTVDYLITFPVFDSWHEMGNILRRAACTRPRDWELPVIACQALGEPPEKAIPASAALACAQISIILVDDMLDDDPRGEYHRIGSGRAANFAVAFQAAGVEALLGNRASTKVRHEAVKSLSQLMSITAFGQELDIQNPSDEKSYWQVVENKSAPFYGCAFHLGALFGEATDDVANEIRKLGELYGEMIQIHDDLNDTMAMPANPDWLQGRKPLPILFAQTVEHPDRERFMELYQKVSAEDALREAQEILIRCGAVSYCVDQLLRRHRAAQNILDKTPLPNKGAVDSVIEAVIAPVHRLFDTLGLSL